MDRRPLCCVFTIITVLFFLATTPFAALEIMVTGDTPIVPIEPVISDTELAINDIIFSPVYLISQSGRLNLEPPDEIALNSDITLKVIGGLYNYPNPFSFSKGQTEIGYRLSKEADLTLEIYNLTGQKVYTLDISRSDYGQARYNKIPFSKASLKGEWLAPGAYLFVLIHNGKVIAKNRMVIVP